MENTNLFFTTALVIFVLIINIILVINIIKAGKYSELTYKLIKNHLNKIEKEKEFEKTIQLKKKYADKNLHEIWNDIQNEKSNNQEYCPACNNPLKKEETICTDCGISLS